MDRLRSNRRRSLIAIKGERGAGELGRSRRRILPHQCPTVASDLAIVEYLRTKEGAKGAVDSSGIHDDPIRVTFKGPHYSFDASIDKDSGKATIVKTTSSKSGFLANLHKGSDTGAPWKRVIDATSILLALISITGLILWMSLAKRRTLGLISLGICIIMVLGMFFMFVP